MLFILSHILLAPHSSATDMILFHPLCPAFRIPKLSKVFLACCEHKGREVMGHHRWSSTTIYNLSAPLHPQLHLWSPMLLPYHSDEGRQVTAVGWVPVCTPGLLPSITLLALSGHRVGQLSRVVASPEVLLAVLWDKPIHPL